MPSNEDLLRSAGARSSGVARIAAERLKQLQHPGISNNADDCYIEGELRDAAIAYAMACGDSDNEAWRGVYPWPEGSFKDRGAIRNLVVAGALIAAEIDRLERLSAPTALPEAPASPTQGATP